MDYKEAVLKAKKFSELALDIIKPEVIVLYGSYAKGTASEDSDIDIAFICNEVGEEYWEKIQRLYRLRRDIEIRIEPVLLELKNDPSGFCEEIIKTGKTIYAA